MEQTNIFLCNILLYWLSYFNWSAPQCQNAHYKMLACKSYQEIKASPVEPGAFATHEDRQADQIHTAFN